MKRSLQSMTVALALVAAAITVPVSASSPSSAAAADDVVQDAGFTLHGGASLISDSGTTDGSAASMANTGLGWNIQYQQADFSDLIADRAYEVVARVKVTHATATPTGTAFSIGAYDGTAGKHLLPDAPIAAGDTADGVWEDYTIGTFVPTASANTIGFYIGAADNAAQISTIAVDEIRFELVAPYVIEDEDFLLSAGTQRAHEPSAADGSVARLENGPTPTEKVEAEIDPARIEAGVAYTVVANVQMERTDYLGSSGDMFRMGIYDVTAAAPVVTPHVFTSPRDDENAKYNFVSARAFPENVTLDPSHTYRVSFTPVNNAAQYPAVRIDSVTLARATPSDALPQEVTAFPHQISPGSSAGVNDGTRISVTVPGTQTATVRILDSNQSVVRTLMNAQAITAAATVQWDGRDGAGNPVTNGVYSASLTYGSTVRAATIRVVDGVPLVAPVDLSLETVFPLGVWYEGALLPKNVTDAAAYADTTFADIAAAGATHVFISNFDVTRPAVTDAVLEAADDNGLKLVINPRQWDLLYSESIGSDEFAMQARVQAVVDQLSPHAAFAGYLIYDEPPHGNDQLRTTLLALKRLFETADQAHPVIIDLSGIHSADKYFDSFDLQAMTSDPYGALWGKPAGDFTDLGYPGLDYEVLLDFLHLQTKKDISSSAPFWTILQAFDQPGWYRDPLDAEVRAMTYEALGRGSTGYVYFMYQATNAWDGMIDPEGNHTPRYALVQQLLGEMRDLQPTMAKLTRVAGIATTTGGGGGSGAYASADVTTHVDNATGDTYLVVVNHDVAASANVTITIDAATLGGSIDAIEDVAAGSAVPFSTSGSAIEITDLAFDAGEGKVLRLTPSVVPGTVIGQDADFVLYNGATKEQADTSASDGSTALTEVTPSGIGWNIQWDWDAAQLASGQSYDLYARVKVLFADDVTYDVNDYPLVSRPTSDAFTVGVYDATAGTPVTPAVTVTGTSLENQLWRTVKVGTFTPSQTNTEFVYVASAGDADDYSTIHVDSFTLVKTP